MNVATLLEKAAKAWSERTAIEDDANALSYRQLSALVARVASGLQMAGLLPGDRVAIWSNNRIEMIVALFAIVRAGMTAVPINARLHLNEAMYIVEDAQAAAVVVDSELVNDPRAFASFIEEGRALSVGALPEAKAAGEPVEVQLDDPAWLFYTSGTTGHPKGAILTHRNLLAMVMNCLADIYSFQPEDIVLHAAPLTHGSGLYSLPALARGSTNIVMPSGHFDPGVVFKQVSARHVTAIAFLAPTQIVAMISHPDAPTADVSSLRAVIYGGGPMYAEHMTSALHLWGPIFVQLYGQGETPMTGTYLRPQDHLGSGPDQLGRLNSIGIPRTDLELQILDPNGMKVGDGEIGELAIRGQTVMSGYWRNPSATAEALAGGWLHTGDLGYQDAHGYIHLVDRVKDMIVTGGSNVYAREVEEAILTHPLVSEVAVVGAADPYWGEAVYAFVVPSAEGALSAEEVIAHCRERLASYKKPRGVQFIAELPKNAYGKVLKRQLRERIAHAHTNPGSKAGGAV